jgi:hypothetical protein
MIPACSCHSQLGIATILEGNPRENWVAMRTAPKYEEVADDEPTTNCQDNINRHPKPMRIGNTCPIIPRQMKTIFAHPCFALVRRYALAAPRNTAQKAFTSHRIGETCRHVGCICAPTFGYAFEMTHSIWVEAHERTSIRTSTIGILWSRERLKTRNLQGCSGLVQAKRSCAV